MKGAAGPTYLDTLSMQPSAWATYLGTALVVAVILLAPAPYGSRLPSLVLGATVIGYLFVLLHILGPRWKHHRWFTSGQIILTIFLLVVAEYLFRPAGIKLDPLYFLPIVTVGLLYGRRNALAMATVAALLVTASNRLLQPDLPSERLNLLILISAFYMSALGVSELRAQSLRRFAQQREEIETLRDQTARRAEQLAVLHRLGQGISSSLEIESVCRAVHASVAELMPCDAFFIASHDQQRDRAVYVYATGDEEGRSEPPTPFCQDLCNRVVQWRRPVVLDPSQPGPELAGILPETLQRYRSLICVPMIVSEQVVGALSAQSYHPSAYDQNDLELLELLAAQAGIALENARHYSEAQDNARRLAVLNRVAQIVTSTLDMSRVMELIYEQVSRVIEADSYFLATYRPESGEIYFEFLIDDKTRFLPQATAVGKGLSWWVLHNRVPLLLTDLPAQAPQLGIEPRIWGEQRASQSWLGVPLIAGDTLLGLLAVASYKPHQFTEADLNLLQSIGQQAAIALANARHHAEVQEKARLDSLTQAYNHGHFIRCLTEEVERAKAENRPLSLILLDIDYFKQYNDTYGHQIGDSVLTETVAAIRANIKRTDFVGRWGGEEFGIVLPNTGIDQALLVAERIRATLREVKLRNETGAEIEAPTVSQGLAATPTDAVDVDSLIVLADRALYRAKRSGRDQICLSQPPW